MSIIKLKQFVCLTPKARKRETETTHSLTILSAELCWAELYK